MKACSYCEFFELSPAIQYSELTYDSGHIACHKEKFTYMDIEDINSGELYTIAQNCEFFELNHEIQQIEKSS